MSPVPPIPPPPRPYAEKVKVVDGRYVDPDRQRLLEMLQQARVARSPEPVPAIPPRPPLRNLFALACWALLRIVLLLPKRTGKG